MDMQQLAGSRNALGNQSATMAQLPPVNEAASQLENNINAVYDLIGTFEERLESLLAPRSPTKEQTDNSVKPRAGSSPLFVHLNNCNERLLQMKERLQEIGRRVEI